MPLNQIGPLLVVFGAMVLACGVVYVAGTATKLLAAEIDSALAALGSRLARLGTRLVNSLSIPEDR